jgi:RHS repeat-associated protein
VPLPLDEHSRNQYLERAEGTIVLDEADFTAALEAATSGRGNDRGDDDALPRAWPVDQETLQSAAAVAGIANDPSTLGAIARFERNGTPMPFTGTVFTVARDPLFDPDTGRVQVTDYRIVAIELSGSAGWVGRNVAFVTDTAVIGQRGRCCGPTAICVPDPTGGGGGGIDPRAVLLRSSERAGVTDISPPAEAVRAGMGLPTIGLSIFTLGDPAGPGRGPLREFPHVCTRVIDQFCARVKPVCEWGDIGFTLTADQSSGDSGSGSTRCGPGSGAPVMGRDVPMVCQHIRSEETLPAECGGYCPSCGIGSGVLGRIRTFCAAAMPASPDAITPCNPPRAGQKIVENRRLQAAIGFMDGQAKTQCTPTGRDGHQQCITCDADGNCAEYVVRPNYDPTVAEGGRDENEEIPIVDPPPKRKPPKSTTPTSPPPTPPPPPPQDAPKPPTPPTSTTPPAPAPLPAAGDKPKPERPVVGPPVRSEPTAEEISARADRHAGDPVRLGDGGLRLETSDLSFPGPVRALEFVRHYNSRSGQRSLLGSKWSFNWDVRVEVLSPETCPDYLSPWCWGLPGQPTAVFVHAGPSTELFLLDTMTGLYLPSAGGTDTLTRTTDEGWALRSADGRIRMFNAEGYLVDDRDRCSAGFRVEYEPTPLFELFGYFCTPAALAERGETLTSRRNWLLAWLLGFTSRPAADPALWRVRAVDFPLKGIPGDLRERLAYARDYLLLHLPGGRTALRVPDSVDGYRRLRPVAVVDDLGRRLELHYHQAPPRLARDGWDFAGHPEAGLLAEVRGPAGTAVRFSYARPADYPAELNELFLTKVHRQDTPGAAKDVVPALDRVLSFTYQWPAPDRTPVPTSYPAYADRVEATSLAYFRTFTACWYRDIELCSTGPIALGLPRLARGDPVELARNARNRYISNVAGNIVTIRNGEDTETESRYSADPWAPDFCRVTAQRYGSTTAAASTGVPPDTPEDAWQTALPKLVFSYAPAGPDGAGGDLTDALLPASLRSRYELEPVTEAPFDPSGNATAPVAAATGPGAAGCDYAEMWRRHQQLPGYRAHYRYTDVPEGTRHPDPARPLRRTRLSPDQLRAVQLDDPAHNDLVSALVGGPTGGQPILSRILGRRRVVAANANRICAWVRQVDRDGAVTYFGLNYHGQVLVEAVADGNDFIVRERLVNADGAVVQERRPTRTPTPWSPAAGYTSFTYDEIDPAANRGWNEWQPVFWSRRGNVVRVEERAPTPGVVDYDELTGRFVTSIGRYATHRYDPLFNQPLTTIEGSLEMRPGPDGRLQPVEVPNRRVEAVLDYQELSLGTAPTHPTSILPALRALEVWGFHWLRTPSGELDRQLVGSWQLPVELFGIDLNGDGLTGSQAAAPEQRAKGLPVLVVDGRPGGKDERVSSIEWAPHGLPARVIGPDGEDERFGYYSLNLHSGGPFGGDKPPVTGQSGSGYRGMLATHTRRRFPRVPLAGPPELPCTALAGPYQWLAPDGTAADALPAFLAALGLPNTLITDILDSNDPTSPESTESVSFTYSPTGHLRRIFSRTGNETVTTDTDGRVTRRVDASGARTETDFNHLGLPTTVRRYDRAGIHVGKRHTSYDSAGLLVASCDARGPAECATGGADGVRQRWAYTGEGRVREHVDPEGLSTTYGYDARKLLRSIVLVPPAPSTERRGMAFEWDDDGRLTLIRHGALPGFPGEVQRERRGYDGLGRLIWHVDRRGTRWDHGWSNRDLPTGIRCGSVPYGAATPTAPPTWETNLGYDDLARPVAQTVNGVTTRQLELTPSGRIAISTGEGLGTTYTTFDAAGNPIWQSDAAGTMRVWTSREHPYRRATAILRPRTAGGTATTATVTELDPRGLPLAETHIAGDVEIVRSWTYDADGDVAVASDQFGATTTYVRNWLGWPTRVIQSSEPGTPDDLTVNTFDRRGALKTVTDPAGFSTLYDYDGFGALVSRRSDGKPQVTAAFGYDTLGRLALRAEGSFRIQIEHDGRGDPVLEQYETPTGLEPLVRRRFDDLGRVVSATHLNPGLTWLAPRDRTVVCGYGYDALNRPTTVTTQVGRTEEMTVQSSWASTGNSWQRTVRYAAMGLSAGWVDTYDTAARLVRKTEVVSGTPGRSASFGWDGDWYTGRVQDQLPGRSPFRQRVTRDPFGLAENLRYQAIDVDADGDPYDFAEGALYCPGSWEADVCAAPLLDIAISRDPIGRIAVSDSRFGNPRAAGSGHVATPQPARWRGFAYTARHQLDRAWELETSTPPNPPAAYSGDAVTVASLAGTAGLWQYQRETAVGGTQNISSATSGRSRWRLLIPRVQGHELVSIELDGAAHTVEHDTGGRVIRAGNLTFGYHQDGRLAWVQRSGHLMEAYGYTADGRLCCAWPDAALGGPASSFLFDGDHMVAALDAAGQPRWEAVWGPGRDRLLEWTDTASGSGRHLVLTDERNSVRATWSPAAARLDSSVDYTPEGRFTARNTDGKAVCTEPIVGDRCSLPAGMPFGFASAYRSPVTGLIWMRQRWYSPELAQFLTRDPLGPQESHNLYAYAGFEPVNRIDPLGLQSTVVDDVRGSLSAWNTYVGQAADTAGGFFLDTPRSGNYPLDEAARWTGTAQGTAISVYIHLAGGFLALGPAMVVALADAAKYYDEANRLTYSAILGQPDPLDPWERIVLGQLNLWASAGKLAEVALFVLGGRDAFKYRRLPGPFDAADVKPLGSTPDLYAENLKKAMGQFQAWGHAQPGQRVTLFLYEAGPTNANVYYQSYRYQSGQFVPTGSGRLGTVAMPPNSPSPQRLGQNIEGPIRNLVAKRMGTTYPPKSPSAPGPDLPATAKPPAPSAAGPALGGGTAVAGAAGSPETQTGALSHKKGFSGP